MPPPPSYNEPQNKTAQENVAFTALTTVLDKKTLTMAIKVVDYTVVVATVINQP